MTQSTKRRSVASVKAQVEKRLRELQTQHKKRVVNSYPHPSKPKVNYFTVANFFYLILMIIVFHLVGHLYFFTAGVYVDTFSNLGGPNDIINISLGSDWLSAIPFIGRILAFPFFLVENLLNYYQTTTLGFVGLTIYIILQSGELIPTVIYESPELMFWLIRKFGSHRKEHVDSNDSDAIKKLKKRHNEYYDSFLDALENIRLACYVIDVGICFFLIEFVRVGYSNGQYKLSRFLEAAGSLTFGLSDLDPLATMRMACSLFLLWVVMKIAMRLTHGFNLFAKRV